MGKKLFAVICVALLVLSFASARIINFGFGASYGFSDGVAPMNEGGKASEPYSGTDFGFDSYISLTFGQRSEIFFDEEIGFCNEVPFSDACIVAMDVTGYTFDYGINYKGSVGYEHAGIIKPFKLSLGASISMQLLMCSYYKGDKNGDYETKSPILMNFGVGVTAKAEFPMTRHLSLFVKGDATLYLSTFYSVGQYHYPEGEVGDGIQDDQLFSMNADNNITTGVSAGLVLFF